jgi:hypothetical protein
VGSAARILEITKEGGEREGTRKRERKREKKARERERSDRYKTAG